MAIILVVLYHSGAHFFRGGYTGVDIFFVISGYLIGGQIYSDKRAGTFSYWSFYYRRAKRILPALFAVLAFVSVAAVYTFPPRELRSYGISASSVALSVSNLYFNAKVGYFTPRADLNPLLMTWSLGVEEQFYFVIPLILSLLVRMRHAVRLSTLAALFLLSFLLCILPGSEQSAFYLLPPRFWELDAGVLLAVMVFDRRSALSGKATCNVAGIAGALLLCAPLLIVRSTAIQAVQLLPAVVGATLLIATPSSWINSHILASSPARFIGKISYSWYLWHWPLLALLRFYSGDSPRPILIAFTIAISFCVAVASYFAVEQPFRKRSRPAKPTVIRYCALCLIIACCGIAVWGLNGIPQRFPHLIALSKDQIRMQTDPCLVDGDRPNLSLKCYSASGVRPVVAIWGDSHGAALSPVLRSYVSDRGYDFDQLTRRGCRPHALNTLDPALAEALKTCLGFNEAALDTIARDKRIQIVILAFSWRVMFQVDGMTICKATSDCFAYMQASIRRLQQCGKTVIAMGDTPEFDFDPVPSAYFSELWLWRGMVSILGNPYASHIGILSEHARALDNQADDALVKALNELPDVQYVKVRDLFCAESGCRFSQGDRILYLDAQHLSTEGASLALTRLQLPARSTLERK